MSFKVMETEDADLVHTFDTFTEVFYMYPIFGYLFPRFDTPEGRKAGIQSLVNDKKDPHSRFLKAVDTNTGEIAGHAVWLLYEGEGPLTTGFFNPHGDVWESQDVKEQAHHFLNEFFEFRINAINNAEGKMLVLDILAVAEKYQRQGVGRMLVQWGTDLADRLGCGMLVESSEAAVHLYQTAGFNLRYLVTIPWPEKWAHLKETQMRWLTRPARAQQDGQ